MDCSIRFWTCACDNCFKKLLFCIGFFFAIFAMSLDQQVSFSVLSVQILLFLHCSALLTSLSHSLRGQPCVKATFAIVVKWQQRAIFTGNVLAIFYALIASSTTFPALVKLHQNEPCSFTHLPFFIEPWHSYAFSVQSGPMNLFFLQ